MFNDEDLKVIYLALLSHQREMIADDISEFSPVYLKNKELRDNLKDYFIKMNICF